MFTYVHDNKGETPAIEEFIVGGSDGYKTTVGEPLVLSSGKLQNVGGNTTKPAFIAQAAVSKGERCPVVRVTPTQHWRTTLNAANTAGPGTKIQLAGDKHDLLGGTSATSSGVAEIVENYGQAQHDEVVVCFS